MKKPGSYYLGNLLIIVSLSLFTYLLYPLVLIYLFPAKEPTLSKIGMTLWIPKIHASGNIVPNVNPWEKDEYEKALKKGIALGKGFALPGGHGVTYLFAHSSGMPWELTHYNTVFLRLGELEKNDQIIIARDGKKFTYRVVDKKEVLPSEVESVKEVRGDILILQTCTPIGTDWKRLLIYAKQV